MLAPRAGRGLATTGGIAATGKESVLAPNATRSGSLAKSASICLSVTTGIASLTGDSSRSLGRSATKRSDATVSGGDADSALKVRDAEGDVGGVVACHDSSRHESGVPEPYVVAGVAGEAPDNLGVRGRSQRSAEGGLTVAAALRPRWAGLLCDCLT